jgi:hypothetical protein
MPVGNSLVSYYNVSKSSSSKIIPITSMVLESFGITAQLSHRQMFVLSKTSFSVDEKNLTKYMW